MSYPPLDCKLQSTVRALTTSFKAFVDRITTSEMAKHDKTVTPAPGVSGTPSNNIAEICDELRKLATILSASRRHCRCALPLRTCSANLRGLQGLDPPVLCFATVQPVKV